MLVHPNMAHPNIPSAICPPNLQGKKRPGNSPPTRRKTAQGRLSRWADLPVHHPPSPPISIRRACKARHEREI